MWHVGVQKSHRLKLPFHFWSYHEKFNVYI